MTTTINKLDLANFYGTEHYYRHWTNQLVYTDGIHYLVEHGAAWLVDAIASWQTQANLNKGNLKQFQLWELEVKNHHAILTCKSDSGQPAVVKQKIEYTDFPFESFKLFVEEGYVGGKTVKVLLLPSEH